MATHASPLSRPRLLTGGALLLLAVGCTSTAASDDKPAGAGLSVAPPSVSAVPTLVQAEDKALPIEAYLLTGEQGRQLATAKNALTDRCMARFGFTSIEPPAPSGAGGATTNLTQRRYFVTNATEAAQYGYGSKTPVTNAKPSAAPKPPAYELALTGSPNGAIAIMPGQTPQGGQDVNGQKVPPGGCLGEASGKLGAAPANNNGGDAQLALDVKDTGWKQSQTDPRLLAAFSAWSGCMKAKGYNYPTPMAATDDPQWQTLGASSEKARQTATADATCKAEHNVVGVWYTVESAYETALIEQNAEALSAIKQDIDKRVKLAAEALAS
ncbi:hypothetical protein GCM10009639_48400 [Kitasatospora putterlickiae]|uniref:Secreted protein n=1 Tax=Kitasatospora putterlickiae TaxID=221725 RepID=A0ABP4J594_9ACTN